MLFSDETLGELLWLRRELSERRKVDRFLLGALLGILHANADAAGRPRGLTIAMPNTFAMSPAYVARFIRSHRLRAPKVSPLAKLRQRAFSLWRELPASGAVWKRDASSSVPERLERTPAKLLFASPPYLDVMKYGKLNWVRLWLLGRSPEEVDADLFASSSLRKYLAFMKGVIHANAGALRDDGYMAFVIGDVRRAADEIDLAQAVADECLEGSGLRVAGFVADELPTKHKVSRIWKDTRGRATRTDRVLILGGRRAPSLREFPQFTW
jgi:site-specific DNA-methyltransferase (adenine-specific)